jgi:hypothetical protein
MAMDNRRETEQSSSQSSGPIEAITPLFARWRRQDTRGIGGAAPTGKVQGPVAQRATGATGAGMFQ